MTEAEWWSCTDPLRMPKLHRDISTPRKRTLLVCAYALHSPGGFRAELARRIVGAMQAAAMPAVAGRELSARLCAAIKPWFPGFNDSLYGAEWMEFGRRPELGSDGWPITWFMRDCIKLSSTGTVNSIATMCLRAVRQRADDEVRPVLNAILGKHGRIVTDALKEEVFALIPEPDRTHVRSRSWQSSLLPTRVRNKVYAAVWRPRVAAASAAMADLVREVFGNPFRQTVIDPAWLTWSSGTVQHIAEHIAATGSFGDMPVLADALEDAGCADEELLRHCREERTHVPGCWALDLILGRK